MAHPAVLNKPKPTLFSTHIDMTLTATISIITSSDLILRVLALLE
jgi:hypothetical protein